MKTIFIIVATLFGIYGVVVFVFRRFKQKRERFIDELKEGQTIKYGEKDEIGKIVSIGIYSCYIENTETHETKYVPKGMINQL